jgi:aminotransferase
LIDYDSIISQRVKAFKPSGIRRFFDIAAEVPGVVSLGVGEPDFVTPWHIREAGIYSLEQGKTYYTSNSGLQELRDEICRYMGRRFELEYDPKAEVLVTVGGSEAIDGALRCLVNPGDEVLIPEPSFVCYGPLTIMAGGVPVPIITKNEDEFKLKAGALQAAITPKTKALILSYPNNPTGALMTEEDLRAIVDVLKNTDIVIISDEIYAELTFEGNHCSIANFPGMKERTLVVSGFSKAYAMTGWRLGYACGPKPLIGAMTKIHQQAIMSAPTTAQFAAIEALQNGRPDVQEMLDSYNMRRRYIYRRLLQLGFDCFEPKGAFYIFPSIKKFGMGSEEFCDRLVNEQKIAVVPGNAFGNCGDNNVRISYAYSIHQIDEALLRIARFIDSL